MHQCIHILHWYHLGFDKPKNHKNSAGIENITTSENYKSGSVLYGMSHSWNSGENNTMHPTQTDIKMWRPH